MFKMAHAIAPWGTLHHGALFAVDKYVNAIGDMAAALRLPLSPFQKVIPPMGKVNGVLSVSKPDCLQGFQREEDIRNRRLKGELIIEEGKCIPDYKFKQVTGKGKGIAIDFDCKTPPARHLLYQDHDASTSGMNIFVNKYGNSNAIPTLGSKINAISPSPINKNFHTGSNDNSVSNVVSVDSISANAAKVPVDLPVKNPEVVNVPNPWTKKQFIKINFCKNNVRLSEDGLAVKLVESAEIANASKLDCSLVTKVFGKGLPPHSVAWELRRQWKRFGQFHFTTLGEGWYLCSFKTMEAMEEVMSGGPWFINNHIIGLERWTVDFSSSSLNGLSSPVWIRLPNLPLQCWDEENVALIASMVGVPLLLDGHMFLWGRREFARVCVRIDLDKPLPLGVWVDGMAGRFFQKVEYERIPSLCFNCGMVGHEKDSCTNKISLAKDTTNSSIDINVRDQAAKRQSLGAQSYGPWLHAKSIRRVPLKKSLSKVSDKALNRGKPVVEKHIRSLNPGKEVCSVDFKFCNEPTVNSKAPVAASIQPEVLETFHDKSLFAADQEESNRASVPEVADSVEVSVTVEGDSAASKIPRDSGNILNIEKGISIVEAVKQDDSEGKGISSSLSNALVFNKAKLSKEVKSLGPIDKLPRRKRKDGVGVQETSLYLKEVVRDNEVFFAGLVETKVSSLVREDINKLVGVEWDFFHHPANGLSGGILIVWKRSEGYFEVLGDHSQVDLGSFHSFKAGSWQVATIYGSKDLVIRRSLWESIDKFLVDDTPSIIGGDFNCILSKEDKRGGKRFSFSQGPKEMKQFLASNDLHEVVFIGPRFTWCNNKEGRSRIWERLDRCMINSVALQQVPHAFVKHLARVASDHSPIALKINEAYKGSQRSFRFENVWRSYPASWNVVLKAWNRKLNVWDSRSLSLAGKVLLIKSSLLSLPIFLSSITLVPKSILQNVDKLCRDFLWNKDNARKGLHYIAWDDICKPKVLGGMGIHSATAKTGPLRSRITWRFIQNPNSFCNRIIISKYGDNVWKDKCRRGQSSSWKILLDGALYLKNIVRWKISNGTKVNALEDTWILDKPISKWPTFVNCNDLSDQTVDNLLSEDRSWNKQILLNLFNPVLMNIIISTKLFPEETEDKIELVNHHTGKSITALAYEARTELACSGCVGNSPVFLNYFKKFKLLPKVEIFWWRLCKNGIPTNSFLLNRGLIQTGFCPCDCKELENPEHVAVHCLQLHKIINRINGLGFRVPSFDSLSNCLNELKRNWDANLLRESELTWRPPPLDWIKINVDATLQRSYNANIGAIIRDHKGRFLYAFGCWIVEVDGHYDGVDENANNHHSHWLISHIPPSMSNANMVGGDESQSMVDNDSTPKIVDQVARLMEQLISVMEWMRMRTISSS
ncbi:hypothetical protein M5K25_018983 [Dendrobium thyrsiflorum]|uniref:CCHC-type domain-containing protein n=1 Tax=Dendrobium thyrsiflorum TaxID=117978 RepID=A0ABD0UKL0_DENTH